MPGEDYECEISHSLGHKRYNIVARELANEGLKPGEEYSLSISTGDLDLTVNILLKAEASKDEFEMTLTWKKVEDAAQLQAISNLIDSFPPDRDYRIIRGRVLDHDNQPVPKAKIITEHLVYRYMFTSPEGRDSMSYLVLADDEGKFELRLIHNDEDWRQEIVLIARSENLKAARLVLDDQLGSGDINNVEISLPQPVELTVNFDLPIDDVIAPLKIFIESPETKYWETQVIQKSGQVCFPYLAPAKYLVSIHQMGNDCAAQVVDLGSGENQTLNFSSIQKAELTCEFICDQRPTKESHLEFSIESKQHSPFESYRGSKEDNFENYQCIELSPDRFEQVDDGRWKSDFPIKNVVGGYYEISISIYLPKSTDPSNWNRYLSREKSKTILVNGDPTNCEPIELEWQVDDGQTIWFTLRQK